MWADEMRMEMLIKVFLTAIACKMAYLQHNDLSIRMKYEMAVCGNEVSPVAASAVSASRAVQVFILGAGLAEVHEGRVRLEAGALCRRAREMQSTEI